MTKVLVLMGPTGVGKTKISIRLAKELNGEIISADSMQIYQELNIGTAKVTKKEMENIPHHLVNIRSMKEEYSVQEFVSDANAKIEEIITRGKLPIIVGGTGLYISALMLGYDFCGVEKNETFREECEQVIQEKGLNFLYEQLLSEKPAVKEKIQPNDQKRIIRALEVLKIGNDQSAEFFVEQPPYEYVTIGLTMDRQVLYQRINARVDAMLQEGILEEAKQVLAHGSKQSRQAIGYKEFFPFLEGKEPLEKCAEILKQHTRNYAKRQLTWMRGMQNLHWIENNEEAEEKIMDIIKEKK